MVNKAKTPGFPKEFLDIKTLILSIQTIIWNASAFHSAINYPQWSYYGFFANRPISMFKPMPEDNG